MPIKLRRSSTPSAVPTNLEDGEIAVNVADAKIFWKDATGTIRSFQITFGTAAYRDEGAFAASSHSHAISEITGLQNALTDLQNRVAALEGKKTWQDF